MLQLCADARFRNISGAKGQKVPNTKLIIMIRKSKTSQMKHRETSQVEQREISPAEQKETNQGNKGRQVRKTKADDVASSKIEK